MQQSQTLSKKKFRWYMRYLHNKIGFFITGMVIIYSLSGIIQTYRDTNFLKHNVAITKQLQPALNETQLGPALKLFDFKVTKKTADTIYFKQGTYSTISGKATYITKEWYSWVVPLTKLHKNSSKDITHYFTTLFGIALLFMSISAFWMFKPGTKLFSKGVILTALGIIASIILLIMI
ncbi:hypothetical protein [Hydrotalea sp.]|uniref:hypothetical protein n=1 Tax=Hydrotalea sp. TaxID=2881279 RepID=UPI0026303881|nr:hypothetical protein [Hydrotalea sp.]